MLPRNVVLKYSPIEDDTQWRTGATTHSRLHSLGAPHELAALIAGGTGSWWAHSEAGLNRILTVKYFDDLGFPRLA
jgi:RNA-directed DNA polymerase